MKPTIVAVILVTCALSQISEATFQGIPGLYCGLESCYDVLGATRESGKDEITKLYRSLARKWHPDRYHNKADKAAATEKFRQIATAYEVLREDESRKDYNELLDNPELYYRHYYRYYRRVYGKVDAQYVILGVITVISAIQYFVMHNRYNEAINYFANVPKYRYQAQDLAKQRGLLPIPEKKQKDASGRKSRHKTKEEIKEQEDVIIRQIIEENIDIKGGFAKPDIKNVLWIQIFLLPVTLYNYIYWYIRWVYLFDIKGEPYGEDEQLYLIAKNFGVSVERLNHDQDVDSLLRQELWKKDKYEAWKKRREEQIRAELAEKPGYKRHRRYMKKGGAGQITFLDD